MLFHLVWVQASGAFLLAVSHITESCIKFFFFFFILDQFLLKLVMWLLKEFGIFGFNIA